MIDDNAYNIFLPPSLSLSGAPGLKVERGLTISALHTFEPVQRSVWMCTCQSGNHNLKKSKHLPPLWECSHYILCHSRHQLLLLLHPLSHNAEDNRKHDKSYFQHNALGGDVGWGREGGWRDERGRINKDVKTPHVNAVLGLFFFFIPQNTWHNEERGEKNLVATCRFELCQFCLVAHFTFRNFKFSISCALLRTTYRQELVLLTSQNILCVCVKKKLLYNGICDVKKNTLK